MTRTVDAVYEGGVLKPLESLDGLGEHVRVRVTIQTLNAPNNGLGDCVGIMPDEDAQEIRQIVEREFEQVHPNEW